MAGIIFTLLQVIFLLSIGILQMLAAFLLPILSVACVILGIMALGLVVWLPFAMAWAVIKGTLGLFRKKTEPASKITNEIDELFKGSRKRVAAQKLYRETSK